MVCLKDKWDKYLTINDRIEMLVNDRFDGNKIAFAKSIGMTNPTAISSYLGKQRRSKPSVDMIISIIKTIHVDPMWLLTGQEPQHHSTAVNVTDFSAPANNHSDASAIIGDPVLAERLRSMETLIAEKDARITELKERIAELKTK